MRRRRPGSPGATPDARANPAWSPSVREFGDDAEGHAQRYLGDYYGFVGDNVDRIVGSALTTPQKVADAVAGFKTAGCDELILFPCNPVVGQVAQIADATGLR